MSKEDSNISDPNIKVVIVTMHGIKSKGKNMKALSDYLKTKCENPNITHFEILNYGKLLATINFIPIVRRLTAEYLFKSLRVLTFRFPYAKIILISHSNATWATGRTVEKHYREFHLDKVILLGCVMRRAFDWSKHSSIKVINFIGRRDGVVFWARLYGMGRSGKYGFKKEGDNLRQIETNWNHSGFVDNFSVIKGEIDYFLREEDKSDNEIITISPYNI